MATVKWARVRVSTGVLQSLLLGETFGPCSDTTAPDDLEVLGVEQPPHAVGMFFYAVCRSNSFKPVPEGGEIPIIEPFVYHLPPPGWQATKGD
jgi:hypothetical protein